jgi:hypothetical protein
MGRLDGSCLGGVALAAMLLLAASTSQALAQAAVSGAGQALRPKPIGLTKPEQQPPALPGAASTGAPAEPSAGKANLSPNEALFDAVNRGDLAAAREAVNRGADIEARDVLGLTPLELSIDLGRNDITFLLLPLRSAGGRPPAGPGEGKMASAAKPAPRPAPAPAPVSKVTVVAAPRPMPPVATARPVLGTDPGVPAPQAGFLGFGASN